MDGLTDEQVNWSPPLTEANSLCVIATHALECARSYVLDIACGLDVGRNRPAEFAAKKSVEELRALVQELGPEIGRVLAEMDPPRREFRSVPRPVEGNWRRAAPRAMAPGSRSGGAVGASQSAPDAGAV